MFMELKCFIMWAKENNEVMDYIYMKHLLYLKYFNHM